MSSTTETISTQCLVECKQQRPQFIKCLHSLTTSDSSLVHLNIDDQQNQSFTTEEISQLLQALARNHVVHSLTLNKGMGNVEIQKALLLVFRSDNCKITTFTSVCSGLSASFASTLIQARPSLQHLSLASLAWESSDLQKFLPTLANVNLQSFSLDIQSWEIPAAETLTTVLSTNRSLTHLSLTSSSINGKTFQKMAKLFQYPTLNIMDLDLSNSAIGNGGARALAQYIPSRPILFRLNLPTTGLTDSGMEAVAEVICYCPGLNWLNVSGNRLSKTSSAYCLGTALGNAAQQALTYVDLSRCHITPAEAMMLRSGFMSSIKSTSLLTLQTLKLRDNLLTENGFITLLPMIHACPILCELDLQNNYIASQIPRQLSAGIEQLLLHPSLQHIHWSDNKELGPLILQQWTELHKRIKHFNARFIHMCNTGLTDADVLPFLLSFNNQTNIEHIDWNRNKLTAAVVPAMINLKAQSPHWKQLQLEENRMDLQARDLWLQAMRTKQCLPISVTMFKPLTMTENDVLAQLYDNSMM